MNRIMYIVGLICADRVRPSGSTRWSGFFEDSCGTLARWPDKVRLHYRP